MSNNTTPYYPQLAERDCGATCLRMVAEYHGVQTTMVELRELTRTTANGADLGGIEQGARALGFETLAAELPFDELVAGDLLPAILHWDRDHFVVVTAAETTRATVHDPASGTSTMSRDEFEAHRYGPGRSRAGLVLRFDAEAIRLKSASDFEKPIAVEPTVDVPGEVAQKNAVVIPSSAKTNTGAAIKAPHTSVGDTPKAGASGWIALLLIGYGVAVCALLYLLHTGLWQAIDLQYREGWPSQIGSLLTAAAGLALAYYLLAKACLHHGVRLAAEQNKALMRYGTAVVAGESSNERVGRMTLLISDSDSLRNWRAYELPTLLRGIVTLIAVVGGALIVEWQIGVLLLIVLVVAIAVSQLLSGRAAVNRAHAQAAEAQRDKAEREYAAVGPLVPTHSERDWLQERLQRARVHADQGYTAVVSEYGASRQLVWGVLVLGSILVLGFVLYRLGYENLQLGTAVWLILTGVIGLSVVRTILDAWGRWNGLRTSRLRLDEVKIPRRAEPAARANTSDTRKSMSLWWGDTPRHKLKLDLRVPTALVGGDDEARHALLQAMFGRENSLGVAVGSGLPSLAQLPDVRVAAVSDPIINATLAENISLSGRADALLLDEVARRVGLMSAELPHGLAERAGEDGIDLSDLNRARTLLARALYAQPNVLIVNALTDSLSAYDESLLLDELLRWAATDGRSLIVNARRVSAAYGFGAIAHVEAGEVLAHGQHNALLKARGAYYYQSLAAKEAIS